MRLRIVVSTVFCLLNFLSANAGPLHLDGKVPGASALPCKELDSIENAVTLEAWIKPQSMGHSGGRIIDKNSAGNSGYLLDTYPGNSLRMILSGGSISFPAKLPANRWSHVAGVFSSEEGVLKLYIDGKEVAGRGKPGMPKMELNTVPLRIGEDGSGSSKFHGDIARVTIYNRALTADELAALARDDSHASRNLSGRVADWSMTDDTAVVFVSSAPGGAKLCRSGMLLPSKLTGEAPPPADVRLTTWYRQPAHMWTDGMPLGNGRLGAMVFGGVLQERIQLNEDTLWSGEPHDYDHPGAADHLAEIRKLINEQKFDEALKLGNETMLGKPGGQASYQPLGDLRLEFENHAEAQDYRRELDMVNSIARVSYRIGDASYRREVFISYPDQVMAMRFTCDKPGKLNFGIALSSPHSNMVAVAGAGLICMRGQVRTGYFDGEKNGTRFEAQVKVLADGGRIEGVDGKLQVKDANAVTLLYTAATSYKNYKDVTGDPAAICKKYLDSVDGKSWEKLREVHVADVSRLFTRVDLDLGGEELGQKPTDERVKAVQNGGADPLLVAQSFQFGRYLLIAGSRPGSQPLNLQGIWNESTSPAWGSKWTLNCNAEINYWPVEVCNLGELHEPLIRMVQELREPGRKTAKNNYNCRGWVVHHNADIWRGTAVVDGFSWGVFTVGGAWLCHHLWEHYAFNCDRDYLARVYPTMKEAAEFYMDFLVPDEQGRLVTTPSISFEQGFHTVDGKRGMLCAGPTMDTEILRDFFGNCISASEILGLDSEFRMKLVEMKARLTPFQISPRTGEIQEWRDDWEPNRGTGQVAPLWALYPGDQITPRGTPELASAAKKTLLGRNMMFGSWCSAMRVNWAARLGDSELFEKMLGAHMRGCVMSSLMSIFSGYGVFQIDGNLGVTAGIAEALVQSHEKMEAGSQKSEDRIIMLLPALPVSWPAGSVKGLCARGGFTVDIAWKDGKLVSYRIASAEPRDVKVQINGEIKIIKSEKM